MLNEVDFTKLARWIVPGWICLFSFVAFVLIDIQIGQSVTAVFEEETSCASVSRSQKEPAVSQSGQTTDSTSINICSLHNGISRLTNNEPSFKSLRDFVNNIGGSVENGFVSALLVAAGSLPLGFSIYQLYFYIRWNSPFSRDGLLSPLLPGRIDDLKEALENLTPTELHRNTPWRANWVMHPFFKQDHGFQARYVELLFIEACQKLDSVYGGLSMYARHHYLHEIMHTLGATTLSIYLGFFAYLYTRVITKHLPLPDYLAISLGLSLTFFLLLNWERSARKEAKNQTEQRDRVPFIDYFVEPAPLFIFFLTLIHLFANPVFQTPSSSLTFLGIEVQVSEVLKPLLTFSAAAIWVTFRSRRSDLKKTVKESESKMKRKGTNKKLDLPVSPVRFFNGLSLALTVLVASELSNLRGFVQWVDWAFFTTFYAFIWSNLVLFKNRHNTKEELFSLEYYTLRRFLTEKQDTLDKV